MNPSLRMANNVEGGMNSVPNPTQRRKVRKANKENTPIHPAHLPMLKVLGLAGCSSI